MRNPFIIISILLVALICLVGFYLWAPIFWAFVVVGPLLLLGFYDITQTKHSLPRVFPILGRTRYMMEWLRPKIYQYFVEPDHDGRPINRLFRNVIYARSKKQRATTPFGTQLDVYAEGYEWMNHSVKAVDFKEMDHDPRVMIGGPDCLQPYSASVLNVSAMSFGSLSKNAILALNGGAKIGNFGHNTGEGGIAPYHDEYQGDLIYQIGTGYFGCRSKDGGFDDELYKMRTAKDNVKMIEIKLSQGAKPGHGGILPAVKATEEIAKIRNIEPFKDVNSPPYHKAFSTPIGLLNFLQKCKDLSGGKPVGIKLCVGHHYEFFAICKAMVETGIKPDFIAVDGGEGGTGAAPLEFSNSVGTPQKEGLAFVHDALVGFDLRKDIKLITAGKVMTGFDIFKSIALGADACYSARAMMMALGCIQALECNSNTCPTGVATQDPGRTRGLVVSDKKVRVANYHRETVESFVELMAAAGIRSLKKINRWHVHRRIIMNKTMRYDEIYPSIENGVFLNEDTIPAQYKQDMSLANAQTFDVGL